MTSLGLRPNEGLGAAPHRPGSGTSGRAPGGPERAEAPIAIGQQLQAARPARTHDRSGSRGRTIHDNDATELRCSRCSGRARSGNLCVMTVSAAFEYVAPVLPARDVSEALRFYVEALGFEVFFRDRPDRPDYAGVRRGGVVLHLQFQFEKDFQAGTAGQAMLRIMVDDPDALFAEYKERDVPAEGAALVNTNWGTREFAIVDPDGNSLIFLRDL